LRSTNIFYYLKQSEVSSPNGTSSVAAKVRLQTPEHEKLRQLQELSLNSSGQETCFDLGDLQQIHSWNLRTVGSTNLLLELGLGFVFYRGKCPGLPDLARRKTNSGPMTSY
jgi:hypothetical protein